jgi:hypothetical protein
MSTRLPLPLRLVQCDWGTSPASAVSRAAAVLTPYKPSGLLCYAASQVNAVTGGTSGSNGAADGRRLFAVHTRHTTTASPSFSPALEASAQPRPEDPSDSLLTRIIDTALPGCRPYVALPVVSSLLRRGGPKAAHAALLNQWTGRHKGLVLVTQTPSDALFLRNAAQLDLVEQTYRVVCRLPSGVAAAVRRCLRSRQSQHGSVHTDSARQQSGAGLTGAAAVLNPYLRAHTQRQRDARRATDLTYGIPLTTGAVAHGAPNAVGAGLLPADVRPHPLVTGGFFDVARGLLRVEGTVKCFLQVQAPLHPAAQRTVEQYVRLQNLFTAPASTPATTNGSAQERASSASGHPWLQPEWRLGVSLDTQNVQMKESAGSSTHGRQPAPRGKSLSFAFRLLSVSAHEDSDVALYEVRTHGDVTADEVAAVFQAEGLSVLNDYVQDTALASAVEEVARRMRAAPPSLLSSLPMGIQHYLRSASAEELVALPLTLVPLEDADRLCVEDVLRRTHAWSPSSAPHSTTFLSAHFANDLERLQHYVQAASSSPSSFAKAGPRHPLQHLLWHAISTLNLTNVEERRAYEQVLTLTFGSGVECAGVAFPDPAVAATVHAMQQLWLTYEQQRQRHPSLAEAARAARQHPLASELRYVRRSVLSESVGLLRVPLTEDITQGGAARGECSFSQAVSLTAALKTGEMSPSLSSLSSSLRPSGLSEVGAWEQLEVPPSYKAAYTRWAASTLVSCCGANVGHAASRTGAATTTAASVETSLWPSPADLRTSFPHQPNAFHAERRGEVGTLSPLSSHSSEEEDCTAKATPPPSSAAATAATSGVRLFLRVEELAELSCAHCGAQGHTWRHCPSWVAEAVAALEEPSAHVRSGSSDEVVASLPANGDTLRVTTPTADAASSPSSFSHTSVLEYECLTTVEDVAAVLDDQAAASAHRREQRAHALAGYVDDHSLSSASSSSMIVPVPNVAATQQYKAAHVLRSESRKPAVHRRTLRCVYCGGHHHITTCPKLQTHDGESALEHDAGAYEAAAGAKPPLFCIKCGEEGHIYRDCPRLPTGLHPATHCPICLQPRTASSHDPQHCPQRVSVPTGYALSGVPLLAGERRRGINAPGGGFVRPRRRRGSVLIADSFVDSPLSRR